MKRFLFAALLLASAAGASDDADAIRALRDESNAGILTHQIDKIMASLADDATVIRGGSGVSVSGKAAIKESFVAAFKDPAFVAYIRTPGEIDISADGTRAAEHGTWQGIWRDGAGGSLMSGDYLAHWTKRDGKWTDRGEVYVMLHCQGSVCRP